MPMPAIALHKHRKRKGENTPTRWTAYVPNWTLDLGIEVEAPTRAEAKERVREEARRLYGYNELRFAR